MSNEYNGLKLKEVIWEVTRKCGKGCKYCGSKAVLEADNPPLDNMLRIAREIADYGVKVVTLSGGEPGELPDDHLNKILDVLQGGKCDVRVVTNGKIISSRNYKARSRINVIGVSINCESDIPADITDCNRYTMITNFGSHNIWEFDKLAEAAKSFGTWQIQLTMGEFLLPPEGIAHLRDKIRQLKEVKYVLADNLQDQHKCTAGITSCGITSDGLVIPCLSERSCNVSGGVTAESNLFINSLKTIWENFFKEIRFSGDGWKGRCRNCIKYPEIKELTPTIQRFRAVEIPDIQVYGITEDVKVYGVVMPRQCRYTDPDEEVYKHIYRDPTIIAYGVTDYSVIAACNYNELLQK